MKYIDVSELKANLSKYLRLASRGTRIVVTDGGMPMAQLGPSLAEEVSWPERLAREGRLRLGTQNWSQLKLSRLDRPLDIHLALRAVREDPSEDRRR